MAAASNAEDDGCEVQANTAESVSTQTTKRVVARPAGPMSSKQLSEAEMHLTKSFKDRRWQKGGSRPQLLFRLHTLLQLPKEPY